MTTSPTTIHLIAHAHIDPVWLWPWTSGLDEALATTRTACDLLDRNPDLFFTLGDVWVLEQVMRIDPHLFDRIRGHVELGRWDLSGGWYIQPDCNLPRAESISMQIELGRRFLREHFGAAPAAAMNIDSFGHAAALPTLMNDAGQRHYVMMRPQKHEMKLPARLLRWRDPLGGGEVLTFRIAGSYCTPEGLTLKHVAAALTDLPAGIGHTMCFIGVGDHGGGPTQRMIDWCRSHRDAIEGAELVFSTPAKFFEAVEASSALLPVFDGELQHHAVGCYSVESRVKRAARQAEHALDRARRVGGPACEAELESAWRSVCFEQFHDTLGGTCIGSAYDYVMGDLGGARALAQRVTQVALRQRITRELPDDPHQRLVMLNASAHRFEGYVEAEPWCEFTPWRERWSLLDAQGRKLPYQLIQAEAMMHTINRLILPAALELNELATVRIDHNGDGSAPPTTSAHLASDRLLNDEGVAAAFDDRGVHRLNLGASMPGMAAPRLHLIDDPSDTWSHGVDRYGNEPIATVRWTESVPVDAGPLMASVVHEGELGQSRVWTEWRVYAGLAFAELRLRVTWAERQRVLKLVWDLPVAAGDRLDGTLGGHTRRPADGKEYPMQDWTRVDLPGVGHAAVVSPHTYALDSTGGQLRLTLLRSPVLAHHDPNPVLGPRQRFADQGEHEFHLRFFMDKSIDPAVLAAHAAAMHSPPLLADLTRGMPTHPLRGKAGEPATTTRPASQCDEPLVTQWNH